MDFPESIKNLIAEYAAWLIEYYEATPDLSKIRAVKEAIEKYRANPSIENQLFVISPFVYNKTVLELIKQPVLLKPVFIPSVTHYSPYGETIDCRQIIKQFNDNQPFNSLCIVDKNEMFALDQLEANNIVFFKKWIMRCNQDNLWEQVRESAREIQLKIDGDDSLDADVYGWVSGIENSKDILLNHIQPIARNQHDLAVITGICGVICGVIIAVSALSVNNNSTINSEGNEQGDSIILGAFGIGLLTGLVSAGGGYLIQNYGDVIKEKVMETVSKVISPCWQNEQQRNGDRDVEMAVIAQANDEPEEPAFTPLLRN